MIQKLCMNLTYHKDAAHAVSILISLLLSLHSDEYYINASSLPFMKNVLVLTMPNDRNYTINANLADNSTVRTHIKITSLLCSLSLDLHHHKPNFSGVGGRRVVYTQTWWCPPTSIYIHIFCAFCQDIQSKDNIHHM